MRPISSFWYVVPYGERYRMVWERKDAQRDLREELSGNPIAQGWIPPEYEIIGKGSWPDWMAYWVPLLSEKAMLCLRELVAPHCEFLPWIKESEHNYTLLNVMTQIPKGNWSCEKSSIYNGVYASADVISLQGVTIPNLFRLERYQGKIFVSDAVATRSVACGLKGVAFVDPGIAQGHLPFIPFRFGRKGTGFIRREDDLSGRADH